MVLQFAKLYVPLILDGQKRQSLRAKLPRGARAGATIAMLNGYRRGAKFATATCVRVDAVSLYDLTTRDAKADGFPSVDALLTALRATYPGVMSLWRIRWRNLVPYTASPKGQP